MTQEDKELLLKEDLCARFPYGVKLEVKYQEGAWKLFAIYYEWDKLYVIGDGGYPIESKFADCKPYLFPISNMTEEQKKEYNILCGDVPTYHYEFGDIVEDTILYDNWESIDYLNAHHFDYRGLIEKGLAIDATGLNIY